MPTDDLITVTEAAKRLRKSTRTLRLWRGRNYGPPYLRIGIALYYRPEDIDAWIDAQTIDPEAHAS